MACGTCHSCISGAPTMCVSPGCGFPLPSVCSGRGPGAPTMPANTPVELGSLACTVVGGLQGAIDSARRFEHTFGKRPYRVFLVWQQRDGFSGDWREDASLELMPVKVVGLGEVEQVVTVAGRTPTGGIKLEEVSPNQVDRATLLGYRDGQVWGKNDANREFFYELRQWDWCPGDARPPRGRFIPSAVSDLDMANSQWVVTLADQFGERDPAGVDQTVPGELYDAGPAELVP